MSVRDMVNQIRDEIREHPPADAMSCSEGIVKLTALMGNVGDETGRWESEYQSLLAQMVDEDPKIGVEKIKIKAQAGMAYKNLQTAKRISELVMEMVNGLKYRHRALEGEYRNAHNQ